MECRTPFTLKERDKLTGDWITVPCGKCPDCVKRYASGWSFRLMQEEKVSDSAHFITMTYDDSYLFSEAISPLGLMTLRKEEFQKFMKRLRDRHQYNSNKAIRYYAVGEYGSKKLRPHYHALIFNARIPDIEASWMKGYVHYGKVEPASCGYCLKYMLKRGQPVGIAENDDREPEFALMSKGLGKGYLSDVAVNWHLTDINNRLYIPVIGNQKVTMPRYYKDKIFSDVNFENAEQAKQVRTIAGKHQLDRMMNNMVRYYQENGIQADHNLHQACLQAWRNMEKDAKKVGIL